MTDVLCLPLASLRELRRRQVGIALKQVVQRSLKSDEAGRIDAVCEVQTDRANGRLVANPEAYSMHHVIEILEVSLPKTKVDIAQFGVDIAHIVEQNAAKVIAD